MTMQSTTFDAENGSSKKQRRSWLKRALIAIGILLIALLAVFALYSATSNKQRGGRGRSSSGHSSRSSSNGEDTNNLIAYMMMQFRLENDSNAMMKLLSEQSKIGGAAAVVLKDELEDPIEGGDYYLDLVDVSAKLLRKGTWEKTVRIFLALNATNNAQLTSSLYRIYDLFKDDDEAMACLVHALVVASIQERDYDLMRSALGAGSRQNVISPLMMSNWRYQTLTDNGPRYTAFKKLLEEYEYHYGPLNQSTIPLQC